MKSLRFMIAVVFALMIIGQFVPYARAEVNEVSLVVSKIPSDPPQSIYFLGETYGMEGYASILGELTVDEIPWAWVPYQSYWNIGTGMVAGSRNSSPNRQRGIYKFDLTPLAGVTGEIKEATLIMFCQNSASSYDPNYPDITAKVFEYTGDPPAVPGSQGTFNKLLHGFEGSGAEDIISQADTRAQMRSIYPLRFIGRDYDRFHWNDIHSGIGGPQYTWDVTDAVKRDLEAGYPVSTLIFAPADPYGEGMHPVIEAGGLYGTTWSAYEGSTFHYKPWISVTYDDAEPKRFEVLKPATTLEGYASATAAHTDGYLLAGSEDDGTIGGNRAVLKFPLAEISLPVTSAQIEAWPQYVDGLDSTPTAYVQLQHYLYENNSAVSTADAVSVLVENVGDPMPVSREYPGALAWAIADDVNFHEEFGAVLNEFDSDFQFVWDVAAQVEADRLAGFSHSSFRIVPTDQNGLAKDEPNYGIYFYAQDTLELDDALTDLIVPAVGEPFHPTQHKYLLRSNPNLYARMPVSMVEVVANPTEIKAPANRDGHANFRGAMWGLLDPGPPLVYGYVPLVDADGNEIVVGNDSNSNSNLLGILKYPLAGVESQVANATLKLYPTSVPVGRDAEGGSAPGYGGAYIQLQHYDTSDDFGDFYGAPDSVDLRYETVRGGDANTQTVATLKYTDDGQMILTGTWLFVGDLLAGANHYGDGVTKFDIPDEILPADASRITSARIEGYFHVNSSGAGHVYMSLQNYDADNDGPGVSYATDSPNVVATTPFAVLDFDNGENDYSFDITADIAAKVAAGEDWASYAWQAAYSDGTIRENGAEVPPVYQAIGFMMLNYDPVGRIDAPALVITLASDPNDPNNQPDIPLFDNRTPVHPADCFESTIDVGSPLLVTPNDVNTWISFDVTDQVNKDVANGFTHSAFRLEAVKEDGNGIPYDAYDGNDVNSPFAPYGISFPSIEGNPSLSPVLELNHGGDPPSCWDPAECPGQANGDANCDGSVNLDDLTALKKAWGKSTSDTIGKGVGEYNCCADFNKIGISEDVVNLDDLTALKIGWGNSYPGSTSNVTCPAGH